MRSNLATALRIRPALLKQPIRSYSDSGRARDKIALPWVWPSDITRANIERSKLESEALFPFLSGVVNKLFNFNLEHIGGYFFENGSPSECLSNIADTMTPMVVSSVVDAINSRDSYGLRQMMVQNMASTYNSALEQMSKQGYSIDIAVHDMSNVKFGGLSVKLGPPNAFNTSINIDERRKRFMYSAAGSHMFAYNKDPSSSALSTIAQSMSPTEVAQRPVQIEFWSTVQARVAVSLSRRGKVVDKDEGYMPIVLSLASPIYPSVLSTPTIYADGRVDDDETGIKFQWRVSDLFLRATNDEADAISRSSKKLKI